MTRLRDLLRRLGFGPRDMAGREDAHIDADAAAQSREPKLVAEGEYPGSVPPNYIKTYDEGRPRSYKSPSPSPSPSAGGSSP